MPRAGAITSNRAVEHAHPGALAVDGGDRATQQVRLADEAGGEDGGRPVVDLCRAPLLHDAALVHEHDAVGHGQRLFLIVRHVEE